MNKDPKIALFGYGAMGKEIHRLAIEQELNITNIFDKNILEGTDGMINGGEKYDFDVAIDFTYPDEVISNVESLAAKGKNIVIGTTGWYGQIDRVKRIAEDNGVGIIYGTNFSPGMQMLFRIVRYSSRLMNKLEGYDIMLHEMHHHRKKDSPSGSALTLANIILSEVGSKNEILGDAAKERIRPEQLHVSSTRGGEITGTHTIYIDSIADTLELTHRARNRSGFAMGALEAAKWIHGRKGFYEFNEMLDNIWEGL